jgi:hypothetical protein
MEFKTRFYTGQKVFIIENNRIISLPIYGIRIVQESQSRMIDVTYSFMKSKTKTLMDQDVVIWRDEIDVYATVSEIIEPFMNLCGESNSNT